MEYIYAAMLLHKAKKAIDEAGVKKVLEAAGLTADEGRIKALVAALDGVNIDEAIKESAVAPVAAAPAAPAAGEEKKAEKKEEKKEEKKSSEEAAAGLGALFG
ncbi:50S ribosomal protein P1 [archaeon]|nr:50S ribosomal protein P1 [archaeon]|tara:strand:- start:810 stop:1118 length:309 start_codon:yes stop_codon:yes gene_type:complete